MLSARSEAIGIGPEHRLTLANVIEIATGTDAGHSQGPPKHPELLAAIRTVAMPRRAQQPDAKTLGRWMQRRNRVIDGVRFAAVSNPKGGSKWWIEDPHDHHQDAAVP